MPKPYENADPLVLELLAFREPGVHGLSDGGFEPPYPWLVENAPRAYPQARDIRTAIELMMRSAVRAIDVKTYREAAHEEFGLASGDLRGIGERRKAAMDKFKVSPRTFQSGVEYEPRILELVARELQVIARRTYRNAPTPSVDAVVARYDLTQKMDELVYASLGRNTILQPGLIFIEGEAGVGKSHFVADYFRNRSVEWLQADTEQALLLSTYQLFQQHDKDVSTLSVPAIQDRFTQLLSSGRGPEVVVIDGWPTGVSMRGWLPDEPACLIVVTTRGVLPHVVAPVLTVRELTADQAITLVRLLNPALGDSAADLATTMGRRPRALANACAFLSEHPEIGIAEFCQVVRKDIRTVLRASTPPGQASIAATYLQMLVAVRGSSSIDLLVFLAFCGHANVTERCAMTLFARNPGYFHDNPAPAQIEYAAAIRPLLSMGLVRRQDDRIYLDPFTAHLVRTYCRHLEMTAACAAVLYFCYDNPQQTLFEAWDLKAYGWGAADIASYFTMRSVAMFRIDISLVNYEPDARAMRDVEDYGLDVDEACQRIWQACFSAFQFLDSDLFQKFYATVQRRQLRRGVEHLMAPWISIQDQLRNSVSKLQTAKHLLSTWAPPSDEVILRRLADADLGSGASTTTELDHWRAAFVLYDACQGALWQAHTQVFLALSKELLQVCFDITKIASSLDSAAAPTA